MDTTPQIFDEVSFLEKYNFNAFVNVTVLNPTEKDFEFTATMDVGLDRATGKPVVQRRSYKIKSGTEERFPGVVANIYLDQMTKLMSQNDNNFGAMVDWSAKAQYYDKLIVEIDDPVNSVQAYSVLEGAELPTQATGGASANGGDGTGEPEDKPFARKGANKAV